MGIRNRFILAGVICFLGLNRPGFADIDPLGNDVNATSIMGSPAEIDTHANKSLVNLTAELNVQRLSDRLTESSAAGFKVKLNGEREFAENLRFAFRVSAFIYNGVGSNVLTGEGKPPEGISVKEANFAWQPWHHLDVQAGILEASFSSLPFEMIESLGFPGTAQRFRLELPTLEIAFVSRQMIPTSSTLGSRYLPYDTTPFLLVNGVEVTTDAKRGASLGASIAYFNFQNLAQGAAQDSQFAGNSVLGLGNTALHYAYDYEGLQATFQGEVSLTNHWHWLLGGSSILNVQAPAGHNQGADLTSTLTFTQADVKLSGDLLYYYNQSDTLPAAYTESDYGNNNRRGPGVALKVELLREALSFYGTYMRANVISESPFQSDRNFVSVGARTSYRF